MNEWLQVGALTGGFMLIGAAILIYADSGDPGPFFLASCGFAAQLVLYVGVR